MDQLMSDRTHRRVQKARRMHARGLVLETLEDRRLLAGIPEATLDVPSENFIGEDFSFSVTFDNVAADPNDVGFGPFIDLVIPVNGADGNAGQDTPDGISFLNATYLGVPVTTTLLTFPDDGGGMGSVEHPYAVDTSGDPLLVTGTAGDQLVVLQLPFGSFTPDQPAATINVDASLSNLADLGEPLAIRSRAGFRFGCDPLNNPATDPSILSPGDASPDTASWTDVEQLTPTLLTLTKTYLEPEDETATGPNFPRQYQITIDIANGQTITDFDIIDELDNTMAFLSLDTTTSASGGSTFTPTLPVIGVPANNNELVVNVDTVTGTAGSNDVVVVFSFYIPEFDADGQRVIPLNGADPTLTTDTASALGDWTPIDPRDPATPDNAVGLPATHDLQNKSIAIQKSVAVLGGSAPGTTLEYTLEFQISDYYTFGDLLIADTLSDGQDFSAPFAPTFNITDQDGNVSGTFLLGTDLLHTVNVDGTESLEFDVSAAMITAGAPDGILRGGLATAPDGDDSSPAAGAVGTIVFRTQISQDYDVMPPSSEMQVNQGDTIDNDVDISGTVRDNDVPATIIGPAPDGRESDDSGASVAIPIGSVSKSIYAVNGTPVGPGTVTVAPGDDVTYSIEYTNPLSTFIDFQLQDFLPLPVFNVNDPNADGAVGPSWSFVLDMDATNAPAPGVVEFGPGDTFFAISGMSAGPDFFSPPQLSIDVPNNQLNFFYGNYDDPSNQSSTVNLLFTVTTNSAPFADGVFLTNQVRASEDNSQLDSFVDDAIVQIRLGQPVLNVTKGVVATNGPNGVFTPAPAVAAPLSVSPPGTPGFRYLGGTVSSDYLDVPPDLKNLDGDLGDIDAGDLVTFSVVVENTGSSIRGAFDVGLRDILPPGMRIPTALESAAQLNLSVTDGTGAPIAFTTVGAGLFDPAGGILLTDPGPTPTQPDGADGGALDQFDATSGRNIMVLTYDLIADVAVVPREQITNTATIFNYAGEPGGQNHVPPTIPADSPLHDDAHVSIVDPAVNKVILATNQPSTTGTNVTIGEIVTYQVEITVPEGTTPDVTLIDTLDQGLAFVGINSIVASPDVTTTVAGGFASVATNVVVSNVGGGAQNQGRRMTLDFGTVINANTDNGTAETITVEYEVVVINNNGNNRGANRNNAAVWRWQTAVGPQQVMDSAPNARIVEPTLHVIKSAAPVIGEAGDVVTFTIDVSHTNPSNADAFNVEFIDFIPGDLNYVPGSLMSTGMRAPTTLSEMGGTVFAAWDAFPDGSTAQLQFQAVIDVAATAGEIITNVADVVWTSLPGDVTAPQSIHNTLSTERTGNPLDPGGAANDYAAVDAENVTVRNPVVLNKALVGTSELSTLGNEVAIGEIVRYRLETTLIGGTNVNVSFVDLLPAGLQLIDPDQVRIAFMSDMPILSAPDLAGANNGADPPTFVMPASRIVGTQNVAFNFGTLVDQDVDGNAERVVLEFNALVTNTTDTNDGDIKTNTFDLVLDGNLVDSSPGVDVVILEPRIDDVTKVIVGAPPQDAGDTVIYRVTFLNTGSTTAFDVRLLDMLDPASLSLALPPAITVSGGVSGINNNSAGNSIDIVFDEIPAGGSVAVAYSAVVTGAVEPSQVVPNTADVTYTSLPGVGTPSASPANATGSQTPGASGAPDGERNGSGGVNDYSDLDDASFQINEPQFTKSIIATNQPSTPGLDVAIGEIVTYQSVITIPEGTSSNAIVVDLPDPGLAIVAIDSIAPSSGLITTSVPGGFAQVVLDANAAIPVDGSSFAANFDTLVNAESDGDAETITITYRAVVLNRVANAQGFTLDNASTYSWSEGTIDAQAQPVTIVEPDLEILNSNGNPLLGDAGDTITFTLDIQHRASSDADAFDVNLTDLIDSLPNDMTYVPGSVMVANLGGATLAGPPDETGGDLSIDWTLFPMGASSTVTFQVTLDITVNPEQLLTNVADITWTSLPGDVTTPQSSNPFSVERTGDLMGPGEPGANTYRTSDSGLVVTPSLDFHKDVIDSSLGSTQFQQFDPAVPDTTIGELVTYALVVDFLDGTTNNVVLTDNLPQLASTNGTLEFVSASLSFVGADLTDGIGGPIVLPVPTASDTNGDGVDDQFAFDFGTIVNAADAGMNPGPEDQLVVTITARVLNTLPDMSQVNFSGDVLTNTAELTADGGMGPIIMTDSADIEIVEPELNILKDASPLFVDGGDTVTFTMTVDHTAASTSDAYDVAITDTLPAGLTYVGNINVLSGPGPAVTVIGQDLTFFWTNIPLDSPGLPYQFTFEATVDATIMPGQTFLNEADLEWSTMPGTDPGERIYTDSDPAEVISSTVTALDPVKSLTATSEAFTPGNDVAVGEIVRYRLQFQITEGTFPNLAMVDTLAPGLQFLDPTQVFVSFTSDVPMGSAADLAGANNGDMPPTFLLDPSRITTMGQQVRFDLGTITNNDHDANAEFITIEYNALVDNSFNTNDSDVLANEFVIDLNGVIVGPTSPGDNSVSVTVREPSITDVTKTVIEFDGTSDTYQVVYSNTGTTTAFDVRLLDVLPAQLTLDVDSISTALLNGAAGVDVSNSAGNTVDVRVFEIPVGGQVVATYRAVLNVAGQTITNTADVTYTSLPGTNGTTVNPTGSQTPGVSGAADGERDWSGGVNDYLDNSQQQIGSLGDFVWHDLNGNGLQEPGEPGLDGVVVNLIWHGANGVFGDGDDVLLTTTTAGGGQYEFSGLPGGDYQVEVDTATVPADFVNTYDRDGNLDSQVAVVLAGGQNRTDVDFGYAASAQFSGLKFDDVNGNGVHDAGEGPLAGVTIYVDLNDDSVLGPGEPSAVTAADGTFTIGGLVPGTYIVREVPPLGLTQTFPAGGAAQLVTLAPGDMLGDVNFGNQPAPGLILDSGGPGVTLIGDTWEIYDPCFGHYNGNASASRPGAGENQAVYAFTGLTPGAYRVSATWSATNRLATNAPYTLTGGVPETVTVNQQIRTSSYPNAFYVNGFAFVDLDSAYVISGDTLTVTLTNDANGWVTADAIRVAPVVNPEIDVSEGGGMLTSGTSVVDFGSTAVGTPVVRTFTVKNLGGGELNLAATIVVPDGFSIVTPAGANSLAPGAATTFQVQFDATRSATFGGDLLLYNSDPNESPFRVTLAGEVAATVIDNGDLGFSTGGAWSNFVGAGFQNDMAFTGSVNSGDTATWTFTSLTPGTTYNVWTTWVEHANRATNAPFTVTGGATPATVQVNQQLAPDDFTMAGTAWENLVPVTVTGTTLTVELSNMANGFVVADAVQITAAVLAPDISVEVDGGDVNDGTGMVEFGATVLGVPVQKTFTVTNDGTQALSLSEPIAAPSGFLATGFGQTILNAGDSTTFTLTLTATTPGAKGGTVSFGTNDGDENPFNFTVTAQVEANVPLIFLDNGDAGFSTVGNWTPFNGIGFQNDVAFAARGSGSSVATWTIDVPIPGTYRVSTTWAAHPNRATNAPYSIDGSAPILVNQQVAPGDFTEGGVSWADFGNFVVAGNTITVTLSNAANGFVIADAIRLERIASPEIAVDLAGSIVADGSGVAQLGQISGGAPQSWTFNIRNLGTEPLSLGGPIVVPAGFTATGFGQSILAPEDSTTFTLSYTPTMAGPFGGTVSFTTNDPDEMLFDFTVAGEVAGAPEPEIIDNDNAGSSLAGYWTYYGAGRGRDLRYAAAGNGSSVFSWNFDLSVPGTYRVSTTWLPHANRATDAPYTIIGGASPVTVDINQELAPNDFTDDGTSWEDIGVFTITGNTLTVQLSNAANQYVIADAVRIEYVSPLRAAAGAADQAAEPLTEALLARALQTAADQWRQSGLGVAQLAKLDDVSAKLFDLPDNMLGGATSVGLLIDPTAAGHGWSVNHATAAGRIDLVTVVAHELGHWLGHLDLSPTTHPDDLMAATLPAGVRRTPGFELTTWNTESPRATALNESPANRLDRLAPWNGWRDLTTRSRVVELRSLAAGDESELSDSLETATGSSLEDFPLTDFEPAADDLRARRALFAAEPVEDPLGDLWDDLIDPADLAARDAAFAQMEAPQ